MIVSFSGLENSLCLMPGKVVVLDVSNSSLFARICESLLSEEGEYAVEPYSIWDDDGNRIKPKDAFLLIENPINLPWNHRLLVHSLSDRLIDLLFFDDGERERFEEYGRVVFSTVQSVQLQTNADYTFANEWDIKKLLKCFSFGVDFNSCDRLLDKLMMFINYVADIAPCQPIAFMNLKRFLNKSDYEEFCRSVFYQKTIVFLIESSYSASHYEYESVLLVDQDFFEFQKEANQSWNPSFCNGDNTSRVLEW